MKIESTGAKQMLYKGVAENSNSYTKGKEVERQKLALETKNTVSSFLENKGTYFDAKI